MTTRTALATTTDLDARIAEAEGSAIVVWRGDAVPFLQVPERIARESSRAARERLLTGWVDALEALDPLYAERLERWTAGGPPPSGDLDPSAFAVDVERLQILSETPYFAALRRYLALVDIEQGDATIADLWHVVRGGSWSRWFGEREVARAAAAAGRGGGPSAELDGWRSAEAALAGEAAPGSGAAVVARAYASVAGSPAWLGHDLGVAEADLALVTDFVAFARLGRLRRAIGELHYELRLYRGSDRALARAYYAGIVGHVIGVAVPEAAYLHAIPAPWASLATLRDEFAGAQLAEVLERRFGAAWWRDDGSAELIGEVAAATTTEDALARLGYDGPDWRPVLRQIRTRLIGEMSGYGGPNITTRAGTRKV